MENITEISFLGNTILQWIIALGIIAGAILIIKLVKRLVIRRLKK